MDQPRLLRISSPLGEGALIATGLHVTEQIGLPYTIEVDVLGRDPGLDASDLLTKDIKVSVVQEAGGQVVERIYHGLVASFQRLGPGAAQRMTYRLVAVPGLWRLGLRRNCRIFQEKTVKEIVEAILKEHSQPAPSWGILPQIKAIPYCTQFNETDLHFVSRLLEEHGLGAYFSHSSSGHTLHISSTAQGFPAFAGGDVDATHETPQFFELGGWRQADRARSAATRFEDMDEEISQPSVVLKKSSDTRTYQGEPAMWGRGEVFNWPGGMATRPGLDTAAVMMGEMETAAEDFAAETRDPRLCPGIRLTVNVRAEDGSTQSRQFVIDRCHHQAIDTSGLVAGAGPVESYSCHATLVAASRTWMPARRHHRPVMSGLYSAKVTGPSGEKIHVDEYGRIKVKFRWDRLARDDDTSSCWVRVMQPAAGAWGGTWFLPRVGDEVMVAFLDGDPDRPVVVGSTYGKDAKPPFSPGSNRAQSGIRTRSYKSDSSEDANVLRFEDKKGAEEVLLHTQKDLTVEVEHDETRTIQNARTTKIQDSNDSLTLQSGNLTVKCELGSITMEAMQSITLKVGRSSVVLDQMGVTVKGMMITEEAELVHQTKAKLVQENGDALVQVQGGIVMLN
jgi:type VI secretion system secreted protein VgrG